MREQHLGCLSSVLSGLLVISRRLKYCCDSSQPNPTASRLEPTVAGVHVRCPLSESFQLSAHYSEVVEALSDGVAFWTHDLLAESLGGLRVSVYLTIANAQPPSDLYLPLGPESYVADWPLRTSLRSAAGSRKFERK